MRNTMTHYLASLTPADFAAIGVVEAFDESIQHMATVLDWPASPARIPPQNINPQRRESAYDLDHATRRTLEELNVEDFRLYRHAVDLLAAEAPGTLAAA